MDRSTTEMTLTDSGARVVLYSHLTYGDTRKIKRAALQGMQFKLDKDTASADLNGANAGFLSDVEEVTMLCAIKSITKADGSAVSNLLEFINDLTPSDGNALFAKVEELTSGSTLTTEQKKN